VKTTTAGLFCHFPLCGLPDSCYKGTLFKPQPEGLVENRRGRPVARVDLAILHEIVRVIQARGKVPERVRIVKRDYQITYLEDHRQRIEEALRRHDSDRLSMLFGQLASKVKYQLLRRAPSRPKASAQKRAPRARTPKARTPRARSTAAARGKRARAR
jgi:hypothetical protein